jgi:3-oxoacyl-[acyl-carrier protein] reductase
MSQQVAIVTGGTRGIGLAIAVHLVKQGVAVSICGRSEASVAPAVAQLQAIPNAHVHGQVVDVTNFSDAEAYVKSVTAALGGPHVLVNNAGITQDNLLLRMKAEAFAQVVETNLMSAFNMTKPCLRPMLKQKFGRIIMMGSVVGSMGNAGQANYAASKAGMVGFAKSMAKEVGAKGITVNVVAPGFIDTDMTKALPESTLQTIIDGVPARRLGHVDDVADVVSFLIGASYVTGQVIHVDGGMVM